jgi:hypothetical protein
MKTLTNRHRAASWQPFAIYDPDFQEDVEESPLVASRLPGKPGEFRESTGSVHLVMSKSEYPLYRKRLLKRHPHCHYCGISVNVDTSNMDHVLPKSRGGDHWPANLVLTCKKCNGDKQSDTLSEWHARLKTELEELTQRANRVGSLIEEGSELYEPTIPKVEAVAIQKAPEPKRPGSEPQLRTVDPCDFKISRKIFSILRMSDRKTLIRGLHGTDVAHYLKAVGDDLETPLMLICNEAWYPSGWERPGISYEDSINA